MRLRLRLRQLRRLQAQVLLPLLRGLWRHLALLAPRRRCLLLRRRRAALLVQRAAALRARQRAQRAKVTCRPVGLQAAARRGAVAALRAAGGAGAAAAAAQAAVAVCGAAHLAHGGPDFTEVEQAQHSDDNIRVRFPAQVGWAGSWRVGGGCTRGRQAGRQACSPAEGAACSMLVQPAACHSLRHATGAVDASAAHLSRPDALTSSSSRRSISDRRLSRLEPLPGVAAAALARFGMSRPPLPGVLLAADCAARARGAAPLMPRGSEPVDPAGERAAASAAAAAFANFFRRRRKGSSAAPASAAALAASPAPLRPARDPARVMAASASSPSLPSSPLSSSDWLPLAADASSSQSESPAFLLGCRAGLRRCCCFLAAAPPFLPCARLAAGAGASSSSDSPARGGGRGGAVRALRRVAVGPRERRRQLRC